MKTLDIVCPVYNEEAVIGEFHRVLGEVLSQLSDRYTPTITFVVDPCTDNTLEELKRIASTDPRVRILSMSSRFGHQMALLAGMDHSDADVLVMLDSDLQHPPQLIPSMLAKFESGCDVVYTVRSDKRRSLRRMAGDGFYALISKLSPTPIDHRAADFRLISRKVCRVFQRNIRERSLFLRGLFSWVGFRRGSIEFEVAERHAGSSKYSLGRLLQFALQGIVSFSKWPLHFAILVGAVSALFGLGLAATTLVQYFSHQDWPSGWTTLVILIAGYNGITLLCIGLLGIYIGAIFDEVKARPPYIVDEKINFPEP